MSATPVLSSHVRKREDDEGRHTGPYESMPFTGSERPLIECPHGLVCLNTWFLVGGAVLESHGSFRRWRFAERNGSKKGQTLKVY